MSPHIENDCGGGGELGAACLVSCHGVGNPGAKGLPAPCSPGCPGNGSAAPSPARRGRGEQTSPPPRPASSRPACPGRGGIPQLEDFSPQAELGRQRCPRVPAQPLLHSVPDRWRVACWGSSRSGQSAGGCGWRSFLGYAAANRQEAGTVVPKMESEQLERLRHANQDLLERLKAKQEEIKKTLPRTLLSATSLSKRTTFAERSVPLPKRGKENHIHATKGAVDPVVLTSAEPGASAARAALRSPLKPAACSRERRGVLHLRAGPELGSPRAERSFTPVAAIARETSRAARVSSGLSRPEEESIPVKHRESRKQSTFLHSPRQRGKPRAEAKSVPGRTPAEGNDRQRVAIRDPQTPKSILLTPQGKEPKKEAGRVTFLSDPEEYTIPATSWSVRPFLGYDWIAGLLDTDSSLSEKSEQYFSELREFRQVNKEACAHEQDLGPEASDSLAPTQEADCISSSHQCVYCYRLNRRLFTVPVDSGSACPVCKTPRARRPPETLEEPAYVRVSIPRSTLLPAYKYRIHRRKSFEPTDNLALPSHCLAGWENVITSTSPTLSSLDLRTSLEQKPTDPSHPTLASRMSGGTRMDQLLNLSRSAHFRLSHAQQRARDQSLYYRATMN